MAMLITKFNRLIASRFVWIMFAIVICLAMVFFIPNVDPFQGLGGNPQGKSRGVIGGEEVSSEQYFEAQTKMDFVNRLLGRRFRDPTDQQRAVYEQIALKNEADKLGVTVSESEAVEWLQSYIDQENTRIEDPNRQISWQKGYEWLVGTAGREGLTESGMLSAVQDYLASGGARETLGDTILTSDYDMKKIHSRFFDNVAVEYVELTNSVDVAGIEVTDEMIRKHYDDNQEEYRIPEKKKVSFAIFDLDDFVDPTAPDAPAVQFLYEQRYTNYLTVVERENPAAALDPSFPKTVITHDVQPLTEVENELRTQIARDDYAPKAASKHAFGLIKALSGERKVVAFEEEIAAFPKASAVTSDYLVRTSKVDQVEDGLQAQFLSAAFNLSADRYERVTSEAIVGTNDVYVIFHEDTQETFIPEFEDALETATEKARTAAHELAFMGVMSNQIESIENLATNTLAAAMPGRTDDIQKLDAFSGVQLNRMLSRFGPMAVNSNQLLFASAVADVAQGEYSEPVMRDGKGYIARVLERTGPVDPTSQLTDPDFRVSLAQQAELRTLNTSFSQWSSNLLSQVTIEEEKTEEEATEEEEEAVEN